MCVVVMSVCAGLVVIFVCRNTFRVLVVVLMSSCLGWFVCVVFQCLCVG